jgi:IS1 family transposase
MHDGFRHWPLREGPLDEWWTVVAKQDDQLTPREQRAAVDGEAWGWIAFSPGCTLVPAGVVGQRTCQDARRLGFRLPSATDGATPCCTRDALPHDADAWLAGSGVGGTPPRHGPRGRWPKPRRSPPPDWCDAGVVKDRAHGRVVPGTTRTVSGTTEPIEAAWQASPGSPTIHTSGVERHHLTGRQQARRMGRQVQAVSKNQDDWESPLTRAFAYDHVVVPPRSLRPR